MIHYKVMRMHITRHPKCRTNDEKGISEKIADIEMESFGEFNSELQIGIGEILSLYNGDWTVVKKINMLNQPGQCHPTVRLYVEPYSEKFYYRTANGFMMEETIPLFPDRKKGEVG